MRGHKQAHSRDGRTCVRWLERCSHWGRPMLTHGDGLRAALEVQLQRQQHQVVAAAQREPGGGEVTGLGRVGWGNVRGR